MEIFGLDNESKIDKRAYVDKIAEIKKQIQGKILNLAKGEFLNDRMRDVEELENTIKLLYTDYWDKEKCTRIADKIKLIAARKGMPLEVAFDQFLKVLNFAGIDLTPLEMHDIFHALIGVNTPDLRSIGDGMADCPDPDEFMNETHNIMAGNSLAKHMNIPSVCNTMSLNIYKHLPTVLSKLNGDNLGPKLKAVVIKVKQNVPQINEDLAYGDLMRDIVKDLMPERSAHRKFLIKRLYRIADGERKPNFHNGVHFLPTRMLRNDRLIKHASFAPFALSGILHATYEDSRINHFNSEDFEYGLNKFASYIGESTMENIFNEFAVEKTAASKGLRKALFIGVPATFAYSALQRSRINNGENINSFNRYVAENPVNAATLQAVLVPTAIKGGKKLKAKTIGRFKNVDDYLIKSYAGECDDSQLEKIAKLDKELYNKDMFNDSELDNILRKDYSNTQIATLKYACVLNCLARQDIVDELLAKQAMDENDLLNYLQTAKDCIKIEIEKSANEAKEALKSAMGDMLFTPQGTSGVAFFPGNLVDGIVLNKLVKKLSPDDQKATNKPVKTINANK